MKHTESIFIEHDVGFLRRKAIAARLGWLIGTRHWAIQFLANATGKRGVVKNLD